MLQPLAKIHFLTNNVHEEQTEKNVNKAFVECCLFKLSAYTVTPNIVWLASFAHSGGRGGRTAIQIPSDIVKTHNMCSIPWASAPYMGALFGAYHLFLGCPICASYFYRFEAKIIEIETVSRPFRFLSRKKFFLLRREKYSRSMLATGYGSARNTAKMYWYIF